jgi:transcriptional regulator with XRE-family HTH domain
MDDDAATARFYKLLGARIAQRRASTRLTQAQLAERIGSARTSVTNLERGRQQMPLHQLLRIAEVLQVDLKELIPSRSEVNAQDRVAITVGAAKSDVPPETARLIARILDEHDEANHDTGSKSNRAPKAS